jgi:hypothetical protein
MGRGFLAGTLALIVTYVVVQKGASDKLGSASSAFQQGLKRLFSPQVAGIGNHSGAAETAPISTSPATSGPYFTTV